MVRSLILSFSLSLAVWRFLPGYLDLDLLLLELEDVQDCRVCGSQVRPGSAGLLKMKQSRGVFSAPAAWRDVGEKLKESTEEVGDRLLQALKYPGSIAGSKTMCWYDLSNRDSQSKSRALSWSWRAEPWGRSIAAVALCSGRENEEEQGDCSIYEVGGVRLHLRQPPLTSTSSRNHTDT